MNSLVDQCLTSIQKINLTDFETEMNICEAFLDSYEKTVHLLEYSRGDMESSLECLKCAPVRIVLEAETPVSATAQEQQPAQQQEQQPAQNTTTTANANENTGTKVDENKEEKLWDPNFRRDKKNGIGKENILISIIAFPFRLIVAVAKFIGRWVKSLFSSKKAVSESNKTIANAVSQLPADSQENVNDATSEWLAAEFAKIAHQQINPFVMEIIPNFSQKGDVYDNSGVKEITFIFPPVPMNEVAKTYNEFAASTVGAIDEIFKGLVNGSISAEIEKINDNVTKITKQNAELVSKINLGKAAVQAQLTNKKPRVMINGVNTSDYAISENQMYSLLEAISKSQKYIEGKIQSIDKSRQELEKVRMTTNENGEQVPIQNPSEDEMKALNALVKVMKEEVANLQNFAGLGFTAVNTGITCINNLATAIRKDPKFFVNMMHLRENINANAQQPTTTSAQPAAQPATTTTAPTQPAAQQPAQTTPAPAAEPAAAPTAEPTPTVQPAPQAAAPDVTQPSKQSLWQRHKADQATKKVYRINYSNGKVSSNTWLTDSKKQKILQQDPGATFTLVEYDVDDAVEFEFISEQDELRYQSYNIEATAY